MANNQQLSEKSSDEYEKLTIEKTKSTKMPPLLVGNRIVDLSFVLGWALNMQKEHSKTCRAGEMQLIKEIKWGNGLTNCLVFECCICNLQVKHYTEDPDKKSTINYGFVWGTLAAGTTFGHSTSVLAAMDIPAMTKYTFANIEKELGGVSVY